MLTFRHIASAVWTVVGFMMAASLILHMRYKPMSDEQPIYLDTWTGRVHSSAAEVVTAPPNAVVARTLESPRRKVDVLLLEELTERRRAERHEHAECARVRFAFPVPGSRHR